MNLAVFASGNGSNFEAIVQAEKKGTIDGTVKLLVCDKKDAYAIKRAEEHQIPVFVIQPKEYASKANYEAIILEKLESLNIDYIILAGYMRLIGETLLHAYKNRILNIHPSLLPSFPGLDAIGQAIKAGVKVTGVTVHYVDEGMDTGDILSQEEVAIPPDMTAGELEKLLAERGADLLLRTIHPYAEGRITPQPQDHELATYAPRVSTEQARINWMRPATEIHNQVRAFNPRPGAFTTLRGESVKIWRTTVSGRELEHDQPPGTIIELQPELLVCCGGSPQLLSIQELQVANRSSVSAREFINGMRLVVGERFLQ